MPELNPYREILNEFVDEEFKPLLNAKNKSKAIPFSDMVLTDSEFRNRLPSMSADDIMKLSPDMREKALKLDRNSVIRKFANG